MANPRQQQGNHTRDLILHYEQCPQCGYIMESRRNFELRLNLLEKDLICSRCQHAFKITKKSAMINGFHTPFFCDR